MGAWLDGESAYRLEVEKAKEAKEGATFARAQYEKWKATTLDTQATRNPKPKPQAPGPRPQTPDPSARKRKATPSTSRHAPACLMAWGMMTWGIMTWGMKAKP